MQQTPSFAITIAVVILLSGGNLCADPPEPLLRLSASVVSAAIENTGAASLLAESTDKAKAYPEYGLLVTGIAPDTFAATHGITKGSVILPRGRFQDAYGRDAGMQEKISVSQQNANEVAWVTPAHELRTATAPFGPVGFDSIPHRNITYWYLNHGSRDERWDALILAALISQGRDAETAETCWATARAKGYKPDALMHWSMAFILAAHNDTAASEAHANAYGALRAPTSSTDFPLKSTDWIQLGIHNGNMRRIKQAVDAFPSGKLNFSPTGIARLVELADKNPHGESPPSQLASKMKQRSFLREAKTAGPSGKEPVYLPKLHRKAAATAGTEPCIFPPELVDAELNHFCPMYLGPKNDSPNMDIALEFKMIPCANIPGKPSKFLRGFRFGLVDVAEKSPGEPTEILSVSVGADEFGDDLTGGLKLFHPYGKSWMSSSPILWDQFPLAGKHQTLTMPVFRLDDNAFHSLRIVRVEGWAEALLDGKQIALFPVPPESRSPWLFFQTVGSNVWVQSLRADVLESP